MFDVALASLFCVEGGLDLAFEIGSTQESSYSILDAVFKDNIVRRCLYSTFY